MKIEKIKTLSADLHDESEYVIQMTNLKEALSYGLILKKDHTAVRLNQKAWLKPYVDMNAKLRKTVKNDFQNEFFKFKIFSNNVVFGKAVENFPKYRDIKLVATEKRRNYLVSEPNYQTAEFFTETLLTTKIRKLKIFMNKPVYLGQLKLEICQKAMYEFWYDNMKPEYAEKKAKLCYMDTDSFTVYIKREITENTDIQKMLKQ